MENSRLGEVIGLREELIKKSCSVAVKAHKDNPFLMDKIRGSGSSSSGVVFGFPGAWSANDWFTQSLNSFGETKIDLRSFPFLKSIGNEVTATVNETFLKRFLGILPHLETKVGEAVSRNKQVAFTGHSSGGAIAILSTIWFLGKYIRKQPDGPDSQRIPVPICLTFGSPLVGDRILNHALSREGWLKHFTHFLTRYDIIPRVPLAPFSSISTQLNQILHFLNPKRSLTMKEPCSEAKDIYVTVMRNASTAASHAACHLMGNTNKLLDTLSGFIELSPYRPFGSYVFCTESGKFVLVTNPDAVLQILHYSLQLRSERTEIEGPEVAWRSIREHLSYQDMLQSLEMKTAILLENLEGLPLSSDVCGAGPGKITIDAALNELGLTIRARLCLCAAGVLEKQKSRNQEKIKAKKKDIEKEINDLQAYKTRCEARQINYYDAFKIQKGDEDFKANVNRLKLAGIWDEVIEMVKRDELPDGFESCEEWVESGTKYRRLVEPLDIANYYRHLKNQDTGPYVVEGRPKRYKYTQKWREYALALPQGSSKESCFWAYIEELSIKTSELGGFEKVKEDVLHLERDIDKWVSDGVLGEDVFLEDSMLVRWWKTLPQPHRLGSCIAQRIAEKETSR